MSWAGGGQGACYFGRDPGVRSVWNSVPKPVNTQEAGNRVYSDGVEVGPYPPVPFLRHAPLESSVSLVVI